MSPVTDRVRGVLSPVAASGKILHERVAASEPLCGVVQHFWSVRWDLRGAKPFVPETLPHPNVHWVFEAEGARIVGVHTGRFTTKLQDSGWVFGVKFRPGAFRPYFGRSVASLRDRSVPIDEVFGTKGAALARKVSDLGGEADKAAAVERFLNARKTPSDPNVERVSNIVDEIAEDREIVSVEQVVERWRFGKRTLQQLFGSYVGVWPKWVINRYRLHEAVERLQAGAHINFTELAMELGYFDQAHFIRDFRKLVGCTPAAYTRRHPRVHEVSARAIKGAGSFPTAPELPQLEIHAVDIHGAVEGAIRCELHAQRRQQRGICRNLHCKRVPCAGLERADGLPVPCPTPATGSSLQHIGLYRADRGTRREVYAERNRLARFRCGIRNAHQRTA